MDIFLLNLNEFLKCADKFELLEHLEDRDFQSEERKLQFCAGRYLIKLAAKDFYNIEDCQILVENKKPFFKNSPKHFSISHSENLVVAAFDNMPLGFDIEVMKERDFESLMKRYKIPAMLNMKELFYRFWTEYEAKLKLQGEPKSMCTLILNKEILQHIILKAKPEDSPPQDDIMNYFMAGIASAGKIDLKNNINLYKISDRNSFEKIEIPDENFFEALNIKLPI